MCNMSYMVNFSCVNFEVYCFAKYFDDVVLFNKKAKERILINISILKKNP